MQSGSFDTLADSQLIDVRHYAGVLGVSVPTIWRGIRSGKMAMPRKVAARCTRFQVGEIRALHGLGKQ